MTVKIKPAKVKKPTKAQLKLQETMAFQQKIMQWLDKNNRYTEVRTATELKTVLAKRLGSTFAIDTETSGLDVRPGKIELYGISLSDKAGVAYWIPDPTKAQLKVLAKKVRDSHIVMANAEYDISVLELFGVPVHEFSDVLIGTSILNPNLKIKGLKNLALKYAAGVGETLEMHKILGKKKTQIESGDFLLLTKQMRRVYGSQDADLTWRLWEYKNLQKMRTLCAKTWEIEHSQVRPLIYMKSCGVPINCEMLNEQDAVLEMAAEKMRQQLNKIASKYLQKPIDLNLNSPQQKSNLLFGPFDKKKRCHDSRYAMLDDNGVRLVPPYCSPVTGQGSTMKKYINRYEKSSRAVQLMLHATGFISLRSNFTNKIPGLVCDDGRLRASAWSTGASTGRYTYSDPNLQNIPTCAAEHVPVNIRQAFVALPGWSFLNPDYSQIELRIAGGLAGERVWIDAFNAGESPHIATAIKMFGVKYKEDQYKKSKNLNFGVLYGQTAYALAMMYGISEREAQVFVDQWFAAVPNLVEWIEQEKIICRKQGYAVSMYGRRRPLFTHAEDSIRSNDPWVRGKWERRGINMIVQGTAADIMKIGLARCHQEILGVRFPIEMLITVHDELLFHTPDEHVEEAAVLIRRGMEFPVDLPNPMVVDMGIGKSWGTCTAMRQVEDNIMIDVEEDEE